MSWQSEFRGKVILITGASSGIGEELAEQLAQRGALLTLAARRADVLAQLADRIGAAGASRPLTIECDVTGEGDVERAVAETVRVRGKLDIVFANAGFGVAGLFTGLSLADYRRQFETNVFGVLRTLYAALPEIARARGQLVISGSVAGWVATPGISAYAMSKFALRALANSITAELAQLGVALTLISPGFVESNIRRVDNRGTLHADAPEPLPAWLVVSRRKAARNILRAVARRRREAIITGHGRVLVALERFARGSCAPQAERWRPGAGVTAPSLAHRADSASQPASRPTLARRPRMRSPQACSAPVIRLTPLRTRKASSTRMTPKAIA